MNVSKKDSDKLTWIDEQMPMPYQRRRRISDASARARRERGWPIRDLRSIVLFPVSCAKEVKTRVYASYKVEFNIANAYCDG